MHVVSDDNHMTIMYMYINEMTHFENVGHIIQYM